MRLHLEAQVDTDASASPRVEAVAGMFGLGDDRARPITIVPPTTLDLHPHQLIFITGCSGGGKSTLLRLIADAVSRQPDPPRVLRFDPDMHDGDAERPIIDALGDRDLADALRLLSLAGLSDAFVLLRRARELSDGQRHRFALARLMAQAEAQPTTPACQGRPAAVILADELGTTLDRVTARVLARNLRRWVTRTPVCLVAATTHDDLLEPLCPDVLIEKHLGPGIDVLWAGKP